MRSLTTLALILTALNLVPLSATAEPPAGVIRITTEEPADAVFERVKDSLEAEKFWVVFEADMGKRMKRFAKKWGDDYNRSKVGSVRAMVFCNIWWTNQIANADPDLLGLCPLHLSIYERAGTTVVVLPKLSVLAAGSPGFSRAEALEQDIFGIVSKAVEAGQAASNDVKSSGTN